MTNSSCFLWNTIFVLFLSVMVMIISSSAVDAVGNHELSWIPTTTAAAAAAAARCQGLGAECMAEEHEFDLDSEINRRILATTDYISYRALQRNTVPCSRRGSSYYNCRQGSQANPYSRGCNAITRCRR